MHNSTYVFLPHIASTGTEADVPHEKDLVRAPVLQDPIAAGCQAILAALVPPVYFVRIDLLGALSSISLALSVAHGLDHSGAFVLTLHAVLVRSRFGNNAEAFAYGRAAIAFFERTRGSPLACPTYKVYSSHVAIWALPIDAVLETFRQSIAYGMEYRDAEYLGFGTAECCAYSMLFGGSLEALSSDLERYAVLVRKYRHELSSTCRCRSSQVPLETNADHAPLQTSAWCSKPCFA